MKELETPAEIWSYLLVKMTIYKVYRFSKSDKTEFIIKI